MVFPGGRLLQAVASGQLSICWSVASIALASLAGTIYLGFSGVPVGSEFLPHLDEGAIWARGTLAKRYQPFGS